jgi:hypothetical protein
VAAVAASFVDDAVGQVAGVEDDRAEPAGGRVEGADGAGEQDRPGTAGGRLDVAQPGVEVGGGGSAEHLELDVRRTSPQVQLQS